MQPSEPSSPQPELPDEHPAAEGIQTLHRPLGTSESNASILTAGSDNGPPARGPPQTAQSVFRHGEVLQPHLKVNANAAQTNTQQPQPMQMVQAFPTLRRENNGQMSPTAPLMPSAQHLRGHPQAQAMPMAAPMTAASATSTARAPAASSTMPRREAGQAAPVWVIEEVIDFGLDTSEGPDLDRDVDDHAFRCNARLVQHYRTSLFESCTRNMCADEEKDRC